MAEARLVNVSKRFGRIDVVKAVNLDVQDGEFMVLLGPSGCGKTTTMRMIAGLEEMTSGEIWLGGRLVNHLGPKDRDISMVFQNYGLYPNLTVYENIRFPLRMRRIPAGEHRERVRRALEMVELTEFADRRPGQLSGGQRQRVALGRAIVRTPSVCLMDEPLSNLDAQLRQEMRHELRELQQRLGLTVVYVTHDQTEAMSMADQVVLLNQGRIEQSAAPRLLYARPASTFAARFIGTPAMNLLRLDNGYIAGSQVAVNHGAAMLGIRPESVSLNGTVPATVRSLEYLGADLVLRCAIGDERITVRADGKSELAEGAQVMLHWPAQAEHYFDSHGRRTA